MHLPYEHGLSDGDPVIYASGDGNAIEGIISGETYYVIVIDRNSFYLVDNQADALTIAATLPTDEILEEYQYDVTSVTPPVGVIDIGRTDTTGNVHSFYPGFDPAPAVDASLDQIDLGFVHDLTTGQPVMYDIGGNSLDTSETPFRIGGLFDGWIYYAVVIDDTTIQLAKTPEDAYAGQNIIDLSLTNVGFGGQPTAGTSHSIVPRITRGYDVGFDPSTAALDGSADTINIGRNHGLVTGDDVYYLVDNGGSAITGLTDGQKFYVSVVNDTTVKLFNTATPITSSV